MQTNMNTTPAERGPSDSLSHATGADPCVIDYHGECWFAIRPDQLWAYLEQVESLESRLAWLSDLHLEGDGLRSGSILWGVITPPLPYRMQLMVNLDQCDRPTRIVATVHGDLEGRALLLLAADGGGTRVTATWTIEMMQRPMRMAARVAHPLLRWGHDAVVDMTVAGFRRHLAAGTGAPSA